jgi:hypothetical protein
MEAYEQHPHAILVGNRFGTNTIHSMPRLRWFSNYLSSLIISLAAREWICDAQCGMRIYPLQELLSLSLEANGYALETEVLIKFCRQYRTLKPAVVNIPISCRYPAGTTTSRYRAWMDSWRILKVILRSLTHSHSSMPSSDIK